ncbi:unnamed protein product, partial [Lymnaea stagnalis]
QCFCAVGVITNLLSIAVFLRQGVRDTVNISLLGLSISDLFSLITVAWLNISQTPLFASQKLPFIPLEVAYLTGGWPHVFFTRITTWITVYITLEKCCCIVAPMKVKAVFTPRRTVIYNILVYVVILASIAPIYYTARLSEKFVPERNETLLGIIFISGRDDIEAVSFHINNILPLTGFAVIIIGTAILASRLKQISKWRLTAASNARSDEMQNRDTKIVKMVVFISANFIVCYLPGTVVFIWMMLDPGLRIDGRHSDLFQAAFATLFLLEALNASVNIFVYVGMSSKFRKTLVSMTCFQNNGAN